MLVLAAVALELNTEFKDKFKLIVMAMVIHFLLWNPILKVIRTLMRLWGQPLRRHGHPEDDFLELPRYRPGLGSNKMCYLARLIHSTKAQVIIIYEIKSSKYKSSNRNQCLDMDNSIVVPSNRRSEGLWLMWSEDLQVHVHISWRF
jgi:hypothetical protein